MTIERIRNYIAKCGFQSQLPFSFSSSIGGGNSTVAGSARMPEFFFQVDSGIQCYTEDDGEPVEEIVATIIQPRHGDAEESKAEELLLNSTSMRNMQTKLSGLLAGISCRKVFMLTHQFLPKSTFS